MEQWSDEAAKGAFFVLRLLLPSRRKCTLNKYSNFRLPFPRVPFAEVLARKVLKGESIRGAFQFIVLSRVSWFPEMPADEASLAVDSWPGLSG